MCSGYQLHYVMRWLQWFVNFGEGKIREQPKMIWLSWDKMCLPKEEGGLGFRDLRAFNTTLLAKQSWHLQTCTNSLVHWVFKARCFSHGDFLSIELGYHPSYA